MHEFFIGIHITLLIWYKHDEFFQINKIARAHSTWFLNARSISVIK